jgi:hypothetical protein
MRDWQAKLWYNVLLGVLNENARFAGQLTAEEVLELVSRDTPETRKAELWRKLLEGDEESNET